MLYNFLSFFPFSVDVGASGVSGVSGVSGASGVSGRVYGTGSGVETVGPSRVRNNGDRDGPLLVERVQDPPSRVGAVVHQQLHPVVVVWGQGDRRQWVRVTELARLLELNLHSTGAVRNKISVMEGYLRLSRQFVEGGEEGVAWTNLSSAVSVAADPAVELEEEDMEIVSFCALHWHCINYFFSVGQFLRSAGGDSGGDPPAGGALLAGVAVDLRHGERHPKTDELLGGVRQGRDGEDERHPDRRPALVPSGDGWCGARWRTSAGGSDGGGGAGAGEPRPEPVPGWAAGQDEGRGGAVCRPARAQRPQRATDHVHPTARPGAGDGGEVEGTGGLRRLRPLARGRRRGEQDLFVLHRGARSVPKVTS